MCGENVCAPTSELQEQQYCAACVEAISECSQCECQSCMCGDIALDAWQVPTNVNVAQLAADFYLVLRLELSGKITRTHVLDLLEPIKLALTTYTSMIIGSELRHFTEFRHCFTETGPLEKHMQESGIHHNASRGGSCMWWHTYVNDIGLAESLTQAVELFGPRNYSGYGGRRWGQIAELLLWFVTGDISLVTYVNLSWNLVHNGGTYFDKIENYFNAAWTTSHLWEVLEANKLEDVKTLQAQASPHIVKLWQEG